MVRAVLAMGACALLLLIGAAPASAHTSLTSVDPADGALLVTAPASITLTFSEPVQARGGAVRLLDAAGTGLPVDVKTIDTKVVITPEQLGTGTFIVNWRVISPDSHPVSGGSTFSVGSRSAQVVGTQANESDQTVEWLTAAAQASTYLGVLGAAGMVAFELLVLRGNSGTIPGRTRRRRTATAFALTGAIGALLVIPMTSLQQSGSPVGGLGDSATWTTDTPTDGPTLSAILIVVGTAIAWWSTWRTSAPDSPIRSAAGMGGAALTLGALAVVGHTRAFGPPVLVVTADLLHATVAAFWFGGLVALAITIAAARRASAAAPTTQLATVGGSGSASQPTDIVSDSTAGAIGPSAEPYLIAAALQRFSAMAAVLVAVLVGTGVTLAWRVLGSWDALFGTAYGVSLLVKLAVAAVALGIGAWNRYRLLPAVVGAPDASSGWARIRLAIRTEAAVLVVVLAVTGVLVNSNPVPNTEAGPNSARPAATTIEQSTPLGTSTVAITLAPGSVGANSLQIRITDTASGQPSEPLADPSIRVSLPAASIGPLARPATRTGPGTYQATVDLPLRGQWFIEIGARTAQFDNTRVNFAVDIR